MNDKVNLAAKLALLEEPYKPGIVGYVNDYKLQIVKVKGEFVWHKHDDTDDFFLVIKGRLTIQLRDRDVALDEGELFVVPRSIQRSPEEADEEAHVLLIEPRGTREHGRRRRRDDGRAEDALKTPSSIIREPSRNWHFGPLAGLACAAVLAGCGFAGHPMSPGGEANSSAAVTASKSAGVRLVRIGTFDQPTYVTGAPGHSTRLYVVAKPERRCARVRTQAAAPFLDISEMVNSSNSEQGLLSVAFAPDYQSSGLFYVDYTDANDNIRSSSTGARRQTRTSPTPASARRCSRSTTTCTPTTTAASSSSAPTATSTSAWATAAARATRTTTGRTPTCCSASSCGSRPAGRRLRDPGGQPVRRPGRQAAGDLGLRAAQSRGASPSTA